MSSSTDRQVDSLENTSYRELRLLEEVDFTPEVSQRHLAHRVGIALGVANLLLRNMVKKGYIRANRVGWKKWVYVLTPTGLAWKVQLTVTYIDRFMGHYRRVRSLMRQDIGDIAMNAESRIAIYGTTELAELTYLALRDMGVTRIDFFDSVCRGGRFLGMPVQAPESMDADSYVKVLVAFSSDAEARRHELYAFGVSPSQVVTLFQEASQWASVADHAEVSR